MIERRMIAHEIEEQRHPKPAQLFADAVERFPCADP